jgi:ribosomal protein L7/L12
MKLDKFKFAKVVSWISRITNGLEFAIDDLQELDSIIDIDVEATVIRPDNNQLQRLMMLMAEGQRRLEAIKTYRSLTGFGLKESKDAVEKNWISRPMDDEGATLGDEGLYK